MKLFIAEKPSVAKAISQQLGVIKRENGYFRCEDNNYVTWCFGHMLELAEPDAYLSADIPLSKSGKKRWRAQDLPIIPDKWQVIPKKEAKEQLSVIKKLLKEAQAVVNAGDPDREGQLLVDEVIEHFNCKLPVQRFWASSMDATSVKRALENLESNISRQSLGIAAIGRSRADWLIGMNLSRAYTLGTSRAGNFAVIGVGRVQTPTLSMICERDQQITNFKAHDFYQLKLTAQHQNGKITANWQISKHQTGLDEQNRLIDKQLADDLASKLKNQEIKVIGYEVSNKRTSQPSCFSLSNITFYANQKYSFTAEEILKACQSLYEVHKLTSYPRSDCGYLPTNIYQDRFLIHQSLNVINVDDKNLQFLLNGCDLEIQSPTFNDEKVTAHHGIIPTSHQGDLSKLNDIERKIYRLIVKRYIAQFYPAYQYSQTKVMLNVGNSANDANLTQQLDCDAGLTENGINHDVSTQLNSSKQTHEIHKINATNEINEIFTATGITPLDLGWKKVYQGDEELEPTIKEEEQTEQHIPVMQVGDNLELIDLKRVDKKTSPPANFTEGSLIQTMENIHKYVSNNEDKKLLKDGDGIGTPATRANIINELKHKGFIKTKGKKLVSTELGQSVLQVLDSSIKSAALTANFERTLKLIAQQSDPKVANDYLDEFIRQQIEFVTEQVTQVNQQAISLDGVISSASNKAHAKNHISELHKCTVCGAGLIRREAKTKGKYWWSCSDYPNCKTTFFDVNGKPNYESVKRAN